MLNATVAVGEHALKIRKPEIFGIQPQFNKFGRAFRKPDHHDAFRRVLHGPGRASNALIMFSEELTIVL